MAAQLKDDAVPAGKDSITVLRAINGQRMTKLWRTDGSIDGYESARNFLVKSVVVSSIHGMFKFLSQLETDPSACIIRGKFVGETRAQEILPPEKPGHYLRRNVLYEDQALHLMMLDIDGFVPPAAIDPVIEPVAAISSYIEHNLPECFHGATYCWQLSSSAGAEKHKGVLKAHVWFWLESPYTSKELKAWAKSIGTVIDSSVFQKIQAHYTARPVFEDGVQDPVPIRIGIEEGWMGDTVDLTIPKGLLVAAARAQDEDDIDLVDPKEKKGVIGAFCRTFSIEDVLERWLSDVFEFEEGSTRRLTFKQGGGAKGGAFITPDREYVVNKHNTDPLDNRATNKFDLVRVHCFGHLDEGADPILLADVMSRPSYEACIAMMRDLPEVRSQLNEVKLAGLHAWLDRINECDNAHDLQSMAEREIAFDLNLADVDRMQIVAALQVKAQELTGVRPTKDIVTRWVKRKMRKPLPDISSEGYPLQTAKNLATICSNLDVTIRYNVTTKEDEILIPGESWSDDNKANASLAWVIDACHREEMRTTNIKDFVTMLADQNQFNPVMTWVESVPWDGVSRLNDFYDTVRERVGEIAPGLKAILMRRWLVSAIKAAADPMGVAAQGVLVFQGVQYAGKTRWLKSLAPANLRLIHEGLTLDPKNKDSVKIAISHWIVELGELDSTFKKADISALKAFITQPFDILRKPFAKTESHFARRTVFGASVNDEQFLQDPTGNRRFWTIPVESVNHDHGIDMQQLWAEVYELYKVGEKHYLSPEEMAMLNDHNMNFTVANPIAELITTRLDWDNFDSNNCRWMTASDVLRWLDVKNPSRFDCTEAGRQITKIIGKNVTKKSNGQNLRPVPLRRKFLHEDEGRGTASEMGSYTDVDALDENSF